MQEQENKNKSFTRILPNNMSMVGTTTLDLSSSINTSEINSKVDSIDRGGDSGLQDLTIERKGPDFKIDTSNDQYQPQKKVPPHSARNQAMQPNPEDSMQGQHRQVFKIDTTQVQPQPQQQQPLQSQDDSNLSQIKDETIQLTERSVRTTVPSRFQELSPHPYQLSIYNRIKANWANDQMGYGNIVYLETGTGKTYIAIMILKYLFSPQFTCYYDRHLRARLQQPTGELAQLEPIKLEPETEEELKMRPLSEDQQELKRKEREEEFESIEELGTLEEELKKQKKVVFITPTQNLVDQQAKTIDVYTNLCVNKYHGGQKQNVFYSDPKQWRQELSKQDVLIVIANKFYDLLTHGFMHMEEIDLIVFDECHHADQDHPYNLIMRDFFFHNFDPDNPLAVKRPMILGLTASPIKQKIERAKVQATEIEGMLQNLSNNLYARFVTMAPSEISQLEKDLKMDILTYNSKFEQNIHAVKSIETGLLAKLADLVQFPEQCYKLNQYTGGASMSTTAASQSQILNRSLLDNSQQSLLTFVRDEIKEEFQMEQDTQILKFLNGRKQMIELDNDFTKEKLSISSFKNYEDKVLIIFCIIIVKNINNLLLEIGPLAVKAFFQDLKHDLLSGLKGSGAEVGKTRARGFKSQQAVKIIDQFCQVPYSDNDTSSEFDVGSQHDLSFQSLGSIDRDAFQVSEKINVLIRMLISSYEQNNNVKTIIFVKDRSVAVYLKKILMGTEDRESGKSKSGAGHLKGLLDPERFKIGFAMGFKSKSIVNKAYRALNINKVSMYQDVLGQLPSARAIKLSQNQLKETLERFRRSELNVLIATNVVEEGLDVSTCNQVICLNELLTVKAFIQMKGRARQENSKFIFVCSREEKESFIQSRAMFDRVINFMKTITTKSQREVVPEKHVLRLRRSQQEEFYEVEETKAKVTAKQAKLLIEKFTNEFNDQSLPLVASKANISVDSSQIAAKLSNQGQNLSGVSSSSNSNLNITQDVQAQIDALGNQSFISGDGSVNALNTSHNVSQLSQANLSISVDSGPPDNHLVFKANYVSKECMKEGTKFFFCVLYLPHSCREVVFRKQNPEKACIKKRDAENHVALLAVKKLQTKEFLSKYLMINGEHPVIQRVRPIPIEKNFSSGQSSKQRDNNNQGRSTKSSNKSISNASMSHHGSQTMITRRTKIISEEEKQQERSKHKKFDQLKKQVTFKPPQNQINIQKFDKPLQSLNVYVFKGLNCDSEYPFKNTHDFLGILFDRKFSNPSMQFLMYQEQRAKQKNLEHLNNLVRKGLLEMESKARIEQREECLSIALTHEDCFQVELPLNQKGKPQDEQMMAAKLQCYHTWLFYYLYSADFKFIKAIFKLKFEFVKILFAQDFKVLFRTDMGQSRGVRDRKKFAIDLLKKLYFPREQKQSNSGNHHYNKRTHQRDNHAKKTADEYIKAVQDFANNAPFQKPVPLLAYSVPVTNRVVRKQKRETVRGNCGMRIDWDTIDRVIEWIRSRIYELCLPTERTVVLFKYSIDDPVRSYTAKTAKQRNMSIAQGEEGKKEEQLGKADRAHLTGRLWDQRFQGNRFVILDQELIHDSQDKPIDLNQGKKEFSVEKAEYKDSSATWLREFRRKYYQSVNFSVNSQAFHGHHHSSHHYSNYSNYSNNYYGQDNRGYGNSSFNVGNNTTMMSMLSAQQAQPNHGEMGKSFKTREFYFLKQGIFEHRLFSKYIVKCRKERHFLDFGKKKRDEILLEEQLSLSGSMSNALTRRMFPQGINAKSFNNHSLKNQRQLLQQQEQAKKRTNTEFDILDQMLTLAPISYNQYQVLQTTCYHMLNFNELLMTESFINDVFGDLECLLHPPESPDQIDLKPADASKDILRTYAQLKDVTHESEFVSRSVRDQLLQKIDIVKEALTSPGACREYDYERLEFYGDSIIGFLVILELFVTQPSMVEGDLDFKRIQKVSNLRFYEVNKSNQFYNYMITESHQVYSGYDHTGFDPPECTCSTIRSGKSFCICKRSSCKITQKHQNELQNKLSQLKLIRKRIEALDQEGDPLNQMFMRGNIYQLAEMIYKDQSLIKDYLQEDSGIYCDESKLDQSDSYAVGGGYPRTETEKIQDICRIMMTQIEGGPQTCLLRNIDKVIIKVESQISQNSKKPGQNNKRQKGPFYYKQLADVVESVTGAVTLACGLNCTQDYLRIIGVLDYDQAHLQQEMTKLVNKQKEKSVQLDEEFYTGKKMCEVEQILGYDFECKGWLIEALTHKSFSREHEKTNQYLEDYERLEFLGDAVLGCLMARYFFLTTQNDGIRKNPKELHKMKTSVINNNLLSLIVIENRIHEYMIYNTKAPSFYEQFEKYVSTVKRMSAEMGSTKDLVKQKKQNAFNKSANQDQSAAAGQETEIKSFDLDTLHEHNLKIFGDVFESLIGAVFLDSQSVEKTWEVLNRLIDPYVQIYADLATLQDHSRTLLLEMWNQKPYTKNLTCKHKTEELENGEKSRLIGIIVGRDRHEHTVYAEIFTKDAKSKVRTFYKHFYQLVKKFVDEVDLLSEEHQRDYSDHPMNVVKELKRIWEKEQEQENLQKEKELLQLQKEKLDDQKPINNDDVPVEESKGGEESKQDQHSNVMPLVEVGDGDGAGDGSVKQDSNGSFEQDSSFQMEKDPVFVDLAAALHLQ